MIAIRMPNVQCTVIEKDKQVNSQRPELGRQLLLVQPLEPANLILGQN